MPGGKTQMLTYTILKDFWWSLQLCASYIFVLTVMLWKAGDKTVVSVWFVIPWCASKSGRFTMFAFTCCPDLKHRSWGRQSIRCLAPCLSQTRHFSRPLCMSDREKRWHTTSKNNKRLFVDVFVKGWGLRTEDLTRLRSDKFQQSWAISGHCANRRILLILIIGEYFNLHMGAETSCQ